MPADYAASKAETVKKHARSKNDTGSPEVQVALLTQRIESLAGHFKKHTQDQHSERGLMRMVAHRKQLLQYLKDENIERYRALVTALGLRK